MERRITADELVDRMTKLLGVQPEEINIKKDPVRERELRNYVAKIEQAHRIARRSKLRFGLLC